MIDKIIDVRLLAKFVGQFKEKVTVQHLSVTLC